MEVWLLELVKGAGRLLIQPLFYFAFIFLFILSHLRVKKERSGFGTRIFNPFSEWKGTWGTAGMAGLFISAVMVGTGVEIPFPFLLLLFCVTLLVSLPLKLTYFSAVYTLGISFLLLFAIPYLPDQLQQTTWINALSNVSLVGVALLLSLLLMTEGIGLFRTKAGDSYPERKKGSRGKWVGQHRVRKLMVVPVLALFPAGLIDSFAPWWPLLSINDSEFGLVVIPFLTGWEWIAKGQLPVTAAKRLGKQTLVLSLPVLILAISSFFVPALSLASVALALLGRESLYIFYRLRDDHHPFFSTPSRGLRVLGVIPGSPGEKMGVKAGEVVIRVNALPVHSESQYYEALQKNGAFSKLEVIDQQGENRYVQRAIYQGEHHELGIVFVDAADEERYQSY
ncbi:PDZ domain-containing protein [Halobacillus salinarum]|uniref:PDZ domain-containing protein n=1 Tax=Halobacillus salinarum TaxID=2932257 RepID=A0ABY4ENV8_9BACI|nr:PDZ domain-containing protein [Halobacillus salinarum]UOQ45766.1 PDZ domain-containing protein [Halobacillus salinarum]